jgi:hypothetical protein
MSSDFKAEGYEGSLSYTDRETSGVVMSMDAIECAARITSVRQHRQRAHVLKRPWEVRSGAWVVRDAPKLHRLPPSRDAGSKVEGG